MKQNVVARLLVSFINGDRFRLCASAGKETAAAAAAAEQPDSPGTETASGVSAVCWFVCKVTCNNRLLQLANEHNLSCT